MQARRNPLTYMLNTSMTTHTHTHTHIQTYLTEFFPGQPRYVGTRKVNHSGFYWRIEMMGWQCGISWTICKSFAPRSRQITMPVPHHSSFFTGWMPFLPSNQQRQSTEGIKTLLSVIKSTILTFPSDSCSHHHALVISISSVKHTIIKTKGTTKTVYQ